MKPKAPKKDIKPPRAGKVSTPRESKPPMYKVIKWNGIIIGYIK